MITALILPICLGLLAWYLPHVNDEKAKRDQDAAEKTAQAQQTWNLLLPHSLESAQKYYMPVCSAALRMDRFVATGAPPREIFYTLLLLMRNMRACRDEVGGFHFKNRAGESVAGGWWKALSFLLVTTFPLEVSEAALDHFAARESYSQFMARFEEPKTLHLFRRAEDIFNSWYTRLGPSQAGIQPFPKYLPLFRMLRAVLRFEVNRPLQHWYGALDDPKDLETGFAGVETLRFVELPGWVDLLTETKDYIEAAKTDFKRLVDGNS